jgi:hypothetical protein
MIPAASRIARLASRPLVITKMFATIDTPGGLDPNPIDLANLSYMDKAEYPNNVVQITGLDSSVNLRLVLLSGGGGTVYYRTSSSSFATNDYVFNSGLWNILSFTGVNSANINVAPNRYIGFVVVPSANDDTLTYQVQNASNNNSVLDTFTALKNTQTADVTPTLSLMVDLAYDDGAPVVNNWGNIRSISTPVSFRLVKTGGGSASVYYRSGGTFDQTDYATNPGSWTALSFTNNISGTIPITVNNYVGFAVVPAATGDTLTYEVRNVSDNNTLMQSFTAIKNAAQGGDVTPNAVNWANLIYNEATGEPQESTQQITGITAPISIGLSCNVANVLPNLRYKITASPPAPDPFWATFLAYTAPFTVTNGQYLTFSYGGTLSGTITVTNVTDSSTVLDTFTCDYDPGGCFLTTAMVGHYGLADDGPELTAMRSLRAYYIDTPGPAAIIAEYLQTSPQIIAAIAAANADAVEYEYVRDTVLAVKAHVDLGEWQQAWDTYLAMYNDLKTRYVVQP